MYGASLRQGPQRAQTTGWWLRRNGSRVRVRSGQDDNPDSWQKKAEQFLRRAFPDAEPGLLALARHAEVQLAFRLRDRAIGDDVHEIVVIDRTVCGRDARSRRGRALRAGDGFVVPNWIAWLGPSSMPERSATPSWPATHNVRLYVEVAAATLALSAARRFGVPARPIRGAARYRPHGVAAHSGLIG
jgi:hypothetical protein